MGIFLLINTGTKTFRSTKHNPNYVSGKLLTYPSPNLTLTLNSRFGHDGWFGEGWLVSFPKTYIDPPSFW